MKIIDFIKNKKLLFSTFGLFLVVSFVSISYASMNTSMMITGSAYVRVDEEIRIIGIKFLNAENGAYETYNGKYSKNSTNMYITLPNINSKITYQVEIENKSDHVYLVSDITGNLVNPNIKYTVENGVVKVVPKKSKITVNITFQFDGEVLPSDITQIATINYKFEGPTASHLEFDNSKVNTECTDVQCALDELYGKMETIKNSKFIKAYTYNQTSGAENYCVTGNESTCKETECYGNKTANSCKAGDIVNYKVNDSTEVTFHVMYDSGNTIIMQSQKNIINNIAWHTSQTNTNGPTTILSQLENTTENWSNVSNQTYTMGTTIFKTNKWTGCSSYNSCTANKYTLASRTARIRLITVQEATNLGCSGTNSSCPKWMYNYLFNATNFDASASDDTLDGEIGRYGYWTINAYSNNSTHAWNISRAGRLVNIITSYAGVGARAVVVVNK